MQIPPSSPAAQAASILSQSTAKDRASATGAADAAAPQSLTAQLEKSGESDPDRDAQGQGDGFPSHKRPTEDQNDVVAASDSGAASDDSLPLLPDEPPSQLDIVG